ncbi:MAG TPA: hypothetical protein VFV23_00945 [Verrucomicrobiae bacterium]|nr:hypothetical protein [Verrucomicrobiae bacterium]
MKIFNAIKILLFVFLFITAGCAHEQMRLDLQKQYIAEATSVLTNGFDSSFIQAIPSQQTEALKKAQPTASDSTPDLYNERAAYYSTLTNMIQELRVRYYFHQEFPPNLCAALEQHAEVLTGIEYPLSASTGNSGYCALLIDKKIQFAEAMICQMVHAIYEAAWEDASVSDPAKQSMASYREWLQKWDGRENIKMRKQI